LQVARQTGPAPLLGPGLGRAQGLAPAQEQEQEPLQGAAPEGEELAPAAVEQAAVEQSAVGQAAVGQAAAGQAAAVEVEVEPVEGAALELRAVPLL
jgi:hypothetical protein